MGKPTLKGMIEQRTADRRRRWAWRGVSLLALALAGCVGPGLEPPGDEHRANVPEATAGTTGAAGTGNVANGDGTGAAGLGGVIAGDAGIADDDAGLDDDAGATH